MFWVTTCRGSEFLAHVGKGKNFRMDFLLSTMRYPQSSNLLKFANSAKCSTEYALTSVPILFSFKTAFIVLSVTSHHTPSTTSIKGILLHIRIFLL